MKRVVRRSSKKYRLSCLNWPLLVRRRTRLRPSSEHLVGSYTVRALVHCAKRCAVYSHRLLPTTRSRSCSQSEHARDRVLSPFLPFDLVHAVSFSSPSLFTRSCVPACARGHRDGQLQPRAPWTLPDVSGSINISPVHFNGTCTGSSRPPRYDGTSHPWRAHTASTLEHATLSV